VPGFAREGDRVFGAEPAPDEKAADRRTRPPEATHARDCDPFPGANALCEVTDDRPEGVQVRWDSVVDDGMTQEVDPVALHDGCDVADLRALQLVVLDE
jgi:hypothetical protein